MHSVRFPGLYRHYSAPSPACLRLAPSGCPVSESLSWLNAHLLLYRTAGTSLEGRGVRSAYPASTRIQAFMAPVLLLFSILKIRDRNCCFAHVVLVQYATVQLQSVTEKIPELAQIPTKQICKLTGNIKFACKWKEVSWKKIIDINKISWFTI